MNWASRLRLPGLHALAGLATVSLTGACTYDFDQFEGLSPPAAEDDASQGGRGGTGGTGKDASAPDASAGQGGSSGSAGAGGSAGTGGGSGGAAGTTGGNGGKGGAGTGGSGGSGATGGAAGTSGRGGAAGTGGSTGAGGGGGNLPDASTDGSGGATGGTGGSGTGGTGGATGGSGGTGGGSGGTTGGTGGSIADASDVNHPLDALPDNHAPDVVADAGFDCASVNGTVYQGHCYYARSVAVDWNTAATTCEAPAHLVTITSAGEQQVVAGLLSNQDRWIGMRRPANSPKAESSFYWVTNETLSYRAWDVYSDADKEPNYTGECVRMRFTDKWADDACTNAYAVICERE